MKRGVASSVIVLTLSVTGAALADDVPAPASPVKVSSAAAPPSLSVAPPSSASVNPATPGAQPKPQTALALSAGAPQPRDVAPSAPAPAAAAPAVKEGPATEAPAPAGASSLPLRPSPPLTLASEPAPTPWLYKAGFAAALMVAGIILWKRRRALGPASGAGSIRVLAKTTMGLRAELALVEVGGMKLVVGITPSSMQTLAVLPDDFADAAVDTMDRAAPRASEVPKADLASRARSLFSSLDMGPPVPARAAARPASFAASRYADERDDEEPESAPMPRPRRRDSEHAREDDRRKRSDAREIPLEGQARGLALAMRNRR